MIKYLSGNITDEELIHLEKDIELPRQEEIFRHLLKREQELLYAYNDISPSQALKQIEKKLQDRKSYKRLYRYAALIIFFTVIGYISTKYYELYGQKAVNEIVIEFNDGSSKTINDKNDIRVYNDKKQLIAELNDGILSFVEHKQANVNDNYKLKVKNGSTFKVRLYDESLIHINSGSNLAFSSTFSNKPQREVFFNGEAYFDVMSDDKLPFIINANSLEVTVLGTKFNLVSFKNEDEVLTLEEGLVSVDNSQDDIMDGESILVKPGNELSIKKSNVFEIKKADIENAILWRKGVLVFQNERFESIIKKLERSYDIKIISDTQELNDSRYTGKFRNKSIFEVLDTFKASSNFDYHVSSDETIQITVSAAK